MLLVIILISTQNPILVQNRKIYQKHLEIKVERFLMSIFYQNKTCKIRLQRTVKFDFFPNFFALHLHLMLEKASKLWKHQNIEAWEGLGQVMKNFVLLQTTVDKIFYKSEEIKQILKRSEIFDTCFCVIPECYCQNLISIVETGH